jgi:hypothetical protein
MQNVEDTGGEYTQVISLFGRNRDGDAPDLGEDAGMIATPSGSGWRS